MTAQNVLMEERVDIKRLGLKGLAFVATIVLAPFAGITNVHALVIYDFTGICATGCTGQATGVLTLKDSYTPGTPLTFGDLMSWNYTSSSGSFNIPGDANLNQSRDGEFFIVGDPNLGFDGPLPASGAPATGVPLFIDIFGSGNYIVTKETSQDPNRLWDVQLAAKSISDTGASYQWALRPPSGPVSPVPLPAPVLLLLVALFGMGAFRWWKRPAV